MTVVYCGQMQALFGRLIKRERVAVVTDCIPISPFRSRNVRVIAPDQLNKHALTCISLV